MPDDSPTPPLSLNGSDEPVVRFANVTKRYGDLTVLDQLNLDVSEGEMVSIIGPSGSGKTTVLRVLMTLETIDDGVIYVDGKPLTHMERNGVLVPSDARYLRQMRQNIGSGQKTSSIWLALPTSGMNTPPVCPEASSSVSPLREHSRCVQKSCCLMKSPQHLILKSLAK